MYSSPRDVSSTRISMPQGYCEIVSCASPSAISPWTSEMDSLSCSTWSGLTCRPFNVLLSESVKATVWSWTSFSDCFDLIRLSPSAPLGLMNIRGSSACLLDLIRALRFPPKFEFVVPVGDRLETSQGPAPTHLTLKLDRSADSAEGFAMAAVPASFAMTIL